MTLLPALIVASLIGAPPDPRTAADALVKEGIALGEAERFDEAILRFEEADRLFPRAIHICNIGLAHSRANRPEKAQHHLLRCQARATEALPSWVARRLIEARQSLERGDFAPVEIVGPPSILRVSHYGDETFSPPLTLWLPLGTHRITVLTEGLFQPYSEELAVTSRAPLRHVFALTPKPPPTPDPLPDPSRDPEPDPEPLPQHRPAPDPEPAPRPAPVSKAPEIALTTFGAVTLVTGLIFYPVALDARDTASSKPRGPAYDDAFADFELKRGLAYGLTIGGVVLSTVGIVLLATADDSTRLSVTSTRGGGLLQTTLEF